MRVRGSGFRIWGIRGYRVLGFGFQVCRVECSGSEAGSYLRLVDFAYHSTLGLRVIIKKKKKFRIRGPLLSEEGTYKTVKARFWPWLEPSSSESI